MRKKLLASVTNALALYTLHCGSILFGYFKITAFKSDKKHIRSPFSCKTRIQAYGGLTDCTGNAA